MRMFAHKIEENKFQYIFQSKTQVQVCFPMLKPTEGSIVEVDVVEGKSKNKMFALKHGQINFNMYIKVKNKLDYVLINLISKIL